MAAMHLKTWQGLNPGIELQPEDLPRPYRPSSRAAVEIPVRALDEGRPPVSRLRIFVQARGVVSRDCTERMQGLEAAAVGAI